MTMPEIRDFFGWKCINMVSRALQRAAKEHPSLKAKTNKNSTRYNVDFTLEEGLWILENLKVYEGTDTQRDFYISPAIMQIFKENYYYGGSPLRMVEPKIPLTPSQKKFLYWYKTLRREGRTPYGCIMCKYMTARTINQTGALPSPYCAFYDVFINKVKNKIDIYKDQCETYVLDVGKDPYFFTPKGLFRASELKVNQTVIKKTPKMLGIPQDKFTSKRKKGEPIVILKDAFNSDY